MQLGARDARYAKLFLSERWVELWESFASALRACAWRGAGALTRASALGMHTLFAARFTSTKALILTPEARALGGDASAPRCLGAQIEDHLLKYLQAPLIHP